MSSLKVVLLPWLAMGHLIPFLELSKCLAMKGIQVIFITTPKNIKRLPKIPENLSSSINLISIPLPHLDGVPDDAESSMDVPSTMQPLLKMRFDLLQAPITDFLQEVKPDWIIYDFTSYWIPPIADKIRVSCLYLSLFNASSMSFFGPPDEFLSSSRTSPKDFAVVPDWIPFESEIAYRLHEAMKIFIGSIDSEIATPDTVRFAYSIDRCDFVAIRSSFEFESPWIELLAKIYRKTVLPIGFLFPDRVHDDDFDDGNWIVVKDWLDKQSLDSVIYVALGSESALTRGELSELAFGLELSGLPFLLVLRDQPDGLVLPEGFEDRVAIANQGLVHLGWAPQVKILSHPSTRGFLTHCGWNSVIEGLGLGRVLVLLPVMNEQGLVARLLAGKGLGLEIARDERDGSLSREPVARAVRLAMVEKEGEALRINAKLMKGVFGDKNLNDRYIEDFIHYLQLNKRSS